MDASTLQLKRMVYAALMAALTAAGAYISIPIPISPVPVSLQTLFVMLAGLLLGSRWGAISVGVYLLAGFAGLPVFAGGSAGIGKLFGPTGGYLVGFVVAAYLVGLMAERGRDRLWVDVVAMVVGTLVIFMLGVPWLKLVTGMSFSKAISAGMLPFLVGAVIKIVAAIPLIRSLRPLLAGSLGLARAAG